MVSPENIRLTPRPQRPAFTLAYLARCDMGEIVAKRGGRVIERRYFRMADVTWEATDRAAGELLERWGFRISDCGQGVQPAPACPICHRLNCDSSLANCTERWR